MKEQKEFKEENLEEDIKEVEMAKKKPDCRTKEGKKSSKCKKRPIKGYTKAKRGLSKLKKSRP